jgi:short-subunit dehydrogenase
MQGKTVVITGGTSGIGAVAAISVPAQTKFQNLVRYDRHSVVLAAGGARWRYRDPVDHDNVHRRVIDLRNG